MTAPAAPGPSLAKQEARHGPPAAGDGESDVSAAGAPHGASGRPGRHRDPIRPMDADRRGLAESCFPLALAVAARFARRWRGGDEYFDAATDGLLAAAARYDPARGVPWPAYAKIWIDGYCRARRRRLAMKPLPPLPLLSRAEAVAGLRGGPTADDVPAPAIPPAPEIPDLPGFLAALAGAIQSDVPRAVFLAWAESGAGRTLAELGHQFGFTRARAQAALASARKAIRADDRSRSLAEEAMP